MTDFLTVKAKRTFAVGVGLKTRHSLEFALEASEARLLEAQGLVEIVGAAVAAVIDSADVDSTATENGGAADEAEKSANKLRKGKADGRHENT